MGITAEWKEVCRLGDVAEADVFEITHKLKVRGGYIYRSIVGEVGNIEHPWPRLAVSVVFVPSGQARKKKKKSTRKE